MNGMNPNISYCDVFEELIGKYLRNTLIYKYNSRKESHEYTPFRHDLNSNAEKEIAKYMRKYIFLYAYSEDEVLKAYKNGRLANLEVAAKKALRDRLPNRSGVTNGLYSELLLDLMITMFTKDVNKLATRAIYRQRTDNQEIKGFDGLHILVSGSDKQIWLGQAKMGTESYCINSIKKDLEDKTNILYTSTELYFIADKEEKSVQEALNLLDLINDLSFDCDEKQLNIEGRAEALKQFLIDQEIKVVFPCLIAYEYPTIYSNDTKIDYNIMLELERIIDKFDNELSTLIDGVEYEVLIWFIPIRNVNLIRSNMGV